MEVGGAQISGWTVELIEQVRAKQRLVDHDTLRRGLGASVRLLRQETKLHAGAALGWVSGLPPGTDHHRYLLEQECLMHAAFFVGSP
jgi:hypothetical protein